MFCSKCRGGSGSSGGIIDIQNTQVDSSTTVINIPYNSSGPSTAYGTIHIEAGTTFIIQCNFNAISSWGRRVSITVPLQNSSGNVHSITYKSGAYVYGSDPNTYYPSTLSTDMFYTSEDIDVSVSAGGLGGSGMSVTFYLLKFS